MEYPVKTDDNQQVTIIDKVSLPDINTGVLKPYWIVIAPNGTAKKMWRNESKAKLHIARLNRGK